MYVDFCPQITQIQYCFYLRLFALSAGTIIDKKTTCSKFSANFIPYPQPLPYAVSTAWQHT